MDYHNKHKKPRRIKPEELRSMRWFSKDDLRSFGHRSRVKQMGFANEEYIGKPIIAIINTWNELNTCHTHFPERVKDIKRGVFQAGGFPVELPAMSLGEQLIKPTSMMYRNFLAMETEELLRAFPIDGAVVMGGCDKTTPAVLMGAASMNLPTIYVPGGAMIRGNYNGQTLGSGTDVWKYWDDRQAGLLSECEWRKIESGIARSPGTCMTMGTAATMMAMGEALGMCLSGASSIPAVDASHNRMASASGRRAVELVWENKRPSDIMTREAFENAIITDMAIGGSTNALIHLLALARRVGVNLSIDDFVEVPKGIPLLVNLKPSGKYVMEDFYYAGGIQALQNIIKEYLHDIVTINGRTLYQDIAGAKIYLSDVIRQLDNPVDRQGGIAVLRGNLAPNGCIIKPTAAEPRLLQHTGKALVYDHIADLKANIDRDDLQVDENTVLIMRNAGPVGAPGMPEWGQLPIPRKLLKQGVRDMVRISDARMSGTSYGACILHVSPEAYIGGPLGLVQTGDEIYINVDAGIIRVNLSDEELAKRKQHFKPPQRPALSGYEKIYIQNVTQADQGCDFDVLSDGDRTGKEPLIF
ncbi:MAG: L-arabinonate dehydratase [Ostreibacterium sp.]